MTAPDATTRNQRTAPLGLPLLHTRYASVVMPFLLSVIMTSVISLVSTLRSTGLAPGVLSLWLGSWALSWVIAFPTLLVVLPLVRKATFVFVQMPHEAAAD
jgi:hypothetical protein